MTLDGSLEAFGGIVGYGWIDLHEVFRSGNPGSTGWDLTEGVGPCSFEETGVKVAK